MMWYRELLIAFFNLETSIGIVVLKLCKNDDEFCENFITNVILIPRLTRSTPKSTILYLAPFVKKLISLIEW